MHPIYSMKSSLSSLVLLGLMALLPVGCSKFLSQNPDDRTQINDIESAKELAVKSYMDYSFVPIFEIRSDNSVDKGSRANLAKIWHPDIFKFKEFATSSYQDSPQGVWRASFEAVAHINQVLYELQRIGAQGEEADQVRGEVLVARAYAMYMLAQAFTIPYNPATAATDLGLPYPTTPENKLLQEYDRLNLKETYDLIVKDYEEGYKLVGDNYKAPKFHFNRQAAAAFGTRLYRTLHNWDRVIELGTAALGNDPLVYTRKINQKGTPYQSTYYDRRSIWSMETEKCNFLVAVSVSGWTRDFNNRYGMTTRLMKYLQNGENFLGVGPAYSVFGSNEFVLNIPKFQEHFRVTNQATNTGYVNTQFVLFGGDEVLFNLAEAYAMKNEFAKTENLLQIFVSNFMKDYDSKNEKFKVTRQKIEEYYKNKVGKESPDPVHGINVNTFNPTFQYTPEQEMYLRACMDMKRIAFFHEGMRWMDIRQYRMDVVHNVESEGGAKEEFIVLKGTDPRVAFQLPNNVIPYLPKNPGYESEIQPITK